MQPALNRKAKGDLAEMKVACDLLSKYTRSDGETMEIRRYSQSLTNGKVRSTKRYTAATVDWTAAYDVTTDRCYVVLGDWNQPLGLAGRRVTVVVVNRRLGAVRHPSAAG